MDNFQIETAQNISIQQQVAGIGERMLAFFVDICIYIAYVILVMLSLSGVNISSEDEWIYGMVIMLPMFLYHLLWETFWNGRSPGKAAVGIRVVMLDGSNPNFSNYLIRWLLRLVDISFTSGSVAIVTLLLSGKGQRLGDIAAKTTVISTKGKVKFNDIIYSNVEENYQPVYPQVTVFTDNEIQNIKTIFYRAKAKSQHHIILKLASKLKVVMDIETEQKPILFIETVIKDYNYYTQL
ncbi:MULTISPECIES: RDD family protein [Croceibacter]|uniref:RDD family protein n=1 Tax=Croceibacter TaxID=216431 RepID=UPI000C5ABE58|nr:MULTISPECIES: RDD family protein [Croceibacter]MBG24809.1 transporter [Croceibacter sp.]|tara:strand:+ start:3215 stop:3928 length:714 start_codon:yes stop_codon:yes gene_type:complete